MNSIKRDMLYPNEYFYMHKKDTCTLWSLIVERIYISFWSILYVWVLYAWRRHNTASQSNCRMWNKAMTLLRFSFYCFLCLDFVCSKKSLFGKFFNFLMAIEIRSERITGDTIWTLKQQTSTQKSGHSTEDTKK